MNDHGVGAGTGAAFLAVTMPFRTTMKTAAPPIALLLACASLLLSLAARAEGRAHEHGAVRLDIAVETDKLSLQMEAPLDALLGFERAPRTEAERKRVDATIARLKGADTLFQPDPAGGCTLARVELTSAVLKLGKAPPPSAAGEHADLDASIEFQCKDSARLGFIDSALFGAFAALQRIDMQVAAPKGQFKRTLTRPAKRIALAR